VNVKGVNFGAWLGAPFNYFWGLARISVDLMCAGKMLLSASVQIGAPATW